MSKCGVFVGSILMLVLLSSCGSQSDSPTVTLYRNSLLDATMRIHWATFDAAESGANYNLDNCQMAAKILNANYQAANDEPAILLGFWCELGKFSDRGLPPINFDAEFPVR